MPNVDDRSGLGSEELRELSNQGPFGGLQTELPISMISELGFAATQNICFRLGRAIARPGIAFDSIIGGNTGVPHIVGYAQFDPTGAGPIQVAFVGTDVPSGIPGLYLRTGSTWTQVAGSSTMGGFSKTPWAVLAPYLCYSPSGSGPVELYNGSAITDPASAPTASAMAEIANHLMTGQINTYTWSGVGDPTDWTSFSSGNNVYTSDLGRITGILKLGQQGYGFHINGIIQIIPTGIGTVPFAFKPLISTKMGCLAQGLLAKFEFGGVDCAAYMSQGNVQLFNQTQSVPIGDAPISGRRRQGARQAIFADLYANRFITGASNFFVTSSSFDMAVTENMIGVPFKALWMLMNNIIWCYNFDEENWTRFLIQAPTTRAAEYTALGAFDFDPGDAAGGYASIFPSLGLGLGNNAMKMDFTIPCEQSMSLTSGKITFGDVRHLHTVKKFRLRFTDNATITYTVTLTNEKGVSQTQVVTLGTGSGDDLSYVFSFSLPGLRFTYNISAPATASFAVIEMTPIYDVGGEQRGGMIDN